MSSFDKIEEIYHAAIALAPAERARLLDERCGDDAELRAEIESLLSIGDQDDDFIQEPPGDFAAEIVGRSANREIIGRTLGRYRVIGAIGAGGMGVVYEAEDISLGRRLALKVLPEEFSHDEERRRRFEREARAASSLSHPNIITIHGTESVDGISFIVSELIEGQTLRQLIAEGPFDASTTLSIAVQIADALASAHSVGVVHRDIKPANIMIRPDGLVKILDFGLAKVVAPVDPAANFDTRDLTGQNRVMGTISYMSPEQMLGEQVDERSDIYSLGVVLYEMLTGEPPYKGASDAAIYAAAIKDPPPRLRTATTEMPPALEEIVLHALEKNPSDRYQTAAEMRDDLEALGRDSRFKISFKRNRRSHSPWIWVAGAAALIVVVGAFYLLSPSSAKPGVQSFAYTQFTKEAASVQYPRLLPDGSGFVYASRVSGNWDVYLRKFADAQPVNLTKSSPADDREPNISPDGRVVVFRSERDGGGLYLVNIDGTGVRRIATYGFTPAFSPDGKEIAFGTETTDDPSERGPVYSRLMILDLASGKERELPGKDSMQPSWSPDGRWIAYWGLNLGGQRDIMMISSAGGEPRLVTDDAHLDWNPVWAPDGESLYFVSDRSGNMNLWRIAVDLKTGSASGAPEPLTVPSRYSQHFSFSSDGRSFAHVQSTVNVNIKSIGFDPVAGKLVGQPIDIVPGSRIATNPAVSPDGEWIAFDSIGDVTENVLIVRINGTDMRQLTDGPSINRAPRWSPDGRRIAFFTGRSGRYQGYVMDADGQNLRQVTAFPDGDAAQLPVWTADSRRILFNSKILSLPVFEADAPTEPQPLIRKPAGLSWFIASSWTTDGKRLVGHGRRPGDAQSMIFTVDAERGEFGPPIHVGNRPEWLADNRRFLFFHNKSIYIHDTALGETKEIAELPGDGLQGFSLTSDQRRLVFAVKRNDSDIWLATEE